MGDKELLAAVERLQRVEEQQKKHIERLANHRTLSVKHNTLTVMYRLAKELERSNKVWELKMTVMRKK